MSSLVYFVVLLRFPPEVTQRWSSKISTYHISVGVSKYSSNVLFYKIKSFG